MLIVRRLITTLLALAATAGLIGLIVNFNDIVQRATPILFDKAGCKKDVSALILGGSASCDGVLMVTKIALVVAIVIAVTITFILVEECFRSWKQRRN